MSAETEDDWPADQIKVGSVTHPERLAKYNRLLATEAESGPLAGGRWRPSPTASTPRPTALSSS